MFDKVQKDTIAAPCTAGGESGIAVIRVSGKESLQAVKHIFRPAGNHEFSDHMFVFGHVVENDTVVDEAMAVYMKAPKTYTREDVVEIQCHGSDLLVRKIMLLLQKCGVREAEPGEFTYRAFANGRIDLTQAEAVMRVIHAGGEKALLSAQRQLEGGVSSYIRKIEKKIETQLSSLAAAIDFPDEVDETESAGTIRENCLSIMNELKDASNPEKGKIEDEGLNVVLCGLPNAGKSSLLNAILGGERAIVTSVPGTTRDTLTESIVRDGFRIMLTDTAGLRDTTDPVEKIGVERTKNACRNADVRVLLVDGSEELQPDFAKETESLSPDIILISKSDLENRTDERKILEIFPQMTVIMISAREGTGIERFLDDLACRAGSAAQMPGVLTQVRHIRASENAARSLKAAADSIENGFPLDLCAVDLRDAIEYLGQITGENTTENILDDVFSRFCVGK